MNVSGEGLASRLWQVLVIVVVFAVTLRLASAVIAPALGVVLWLAGIVGVFMLFFGRHRR